jgi:hypothetical protein
MAAASAIVTTWTTAFFRPTNRLRDLLRGLLNDDSDEELSNGRTEVELLPDLSPEHVRLATGITWEDFCLFVGRDKIVWTGAGVFVWDPRLRVATETTAAAATTATCDFLVFLLATIKDTNTSWIEGPLNGSAPISGPVLSRFFPREPRQSSKICLE